MLLIRFFFLSVYLVKYKARWAWFLVSPSIHMTIKVSSTKTDTPERHLRGTNAPYCVFSCLGTEYLLSSTRRMLCCRNRSTSTKLARKSTLLVCTLRNGSQNTVMLRNYG